MLKLLCLQNCTLDVAETGHFIGVICIDRRQADKAMEDYIILGRIGEGAHGIVMKGRHKLSGQVVALKKVLLKRLEDGIPETALREIKALQVPSKIV